MQNTQYPRLAQACADNSLHVTHTLKAYDSFGKPSYEVQINGRILETISTWGDAPGYECLSFMLQMAEIARDERALGTYFADSEDLLYFDEVHRQLRWVLTDEQVVNFTLLAYDDENNA